MVVGGGPAGVACAVGLSRMGYPVQLINSPRRFNSYEGVSPRVCRALVDAGLQRAAATVDTPKLRQVEWGQDTSRFNSESVIERRVFDLALLEDAAAHGVAIINGQVTKIEMMRKGYLVSFEADGSEQTLEASFLVEARGRKASYGKDKVTGPGSVSLLASWRSSVTLKSSMLESLKTGWIWATTANDGLLHTQLSLDASTDDLRGLMEPAGYLEYLQKHSKTLFKFRSVDIQPAQPIFARGSTPICSSEVGGQNWLKIGDAAMAVDPLSGNGIFQSLSTSLQAPAVINTLITRPKSSRLALDFHRDRIQHLFKRFARIGRDFYRMGFQDNPNSAYWKTRSVWPDDVPLDSVINFNSIHIAERGVVDHGLIKQARVVASSEQPLGMWHLGGLELAPRVQRILQGESLSSVVSDLGDDDSKRFKAWLRNQGYNGG
ncbi:NAD(P)/FAD-dependent oxidoreductase [Pseudomonas sp. zbq_4]|uniref:flavin-dependent monooxygenase QhpG n=1 Tax=Pseudomonas TaxID=286 RepID=UPI00370B041F